MIKNAKFRSFCAKCGFAIKDTNPGLPGLLSGVFISVGINFYTSIFGGDHLPNRWAALSLATIASVVSAFLWAIVAWKLESLQRFVRSTPSRMGIADPWKEIVDETDYVRVGAKTLSAVGFALVGLAVLPIGITLSPPSNVKAPSGLPVDVRGAQPTRANPNRKAAAKDPPKDPFNRLSKPKGASAATDETPRK